jgi:O-antigen/teichoic acid export membrane protein
MSAAPRDHAKQAGVLVWGQTAAKLGRALAPLAIVRLLGVSDVGIFATIMLVYDTLATIFVAGFPGAVLYFHAGRSIEERRAVVATIHRILFGTAAIAASILFALGMWGATWLADASDTSATTYRMLGWMGLFAFLDMPTRVLPNVLLAENQARGAAAMQVVKSLGMVLGMLVPPALGFGVEGFVFGLIAFGVAYFGVHLWQLRRLYGHVPAAPRVSARELWRVALPLGATDMVNQLNGSLDRWLIVLLFTTVEIGIYQQGSWQIPILTTIAYSVGAVYLPTFAEMFRDGRKREAIGIWRHSISKVSLITVPAALVFFVSAEEFVVLVFTEDYLAAAPVFRAYTLLTMARVTAFGSLLIAANRTPDIFKAAVFTLLTNAAISIPMTLWLGFIGPAVGTVIAFVPTVYYYCRFIARAADVPVRQTFPLGAYLLVVLTALPGVALAWAAKTLSPIAAWHPAPSLLVQAAIVLGVYAALGTLTKRITREDWAFVGNWLNLRVMR